MVLGWEEFGIENLKEKDQHQEAVDLHSRFETLEGKKQIEKVSPMLLAFQNPSASLRQSAVSIP